MKIYNKLLKFLEYFEAKKERNKFYFFLLPITFTAEIICYVYFSRLIKEYLLTSDEIVAFFDKNEFGFKNNQIYKKDIITPDNPLFLQNMEQIQAEVKKEFTESLYNIIKQNIPFNIEDYINLYVSVDLKKEPNNEILKIYSIYVRYYRFYFIKKYKYKYILTLLLTIIIIIFYGTIKSKW